MEETTIISEYLTCMQKIMYNMQNYDENDEKRE